MDPPKKKARFSEDAKASPYAPIEAAEVFKWHLISGRTRSSLEKEIDQGGQLFECEFYHQVFGEEEQTQGYKGLSVDMYVHAATYHAWANISYSSKLPGEPDVLELLKEWFPAGLCTDKDSFISSILEEPKRDFTGVGTTLSSTTQEDGSTLLLQHSLVKDTPEWCKATHSRLEPLMIFTIDGANFIDKDDEQWEVVLAVRQEKQQQSLVGIMTLYNFFAWPDARRPRLSQILVVPPYQGQGIGRLLLTAAYNMAKERDTLPLTFEDPSPGLQQLREKLELQMLLSCPWVLDAAQQAIAAAGSGSAGKAASAARSKAQAAEGAAAAGDKPLQLPPSIRERIVKELKIHTAQVLLAWEALLFLQPAVQESAALAVAFQDLLMQRMKQRYGSWEGEMAQSKVGPITIRADDEEMPEWVLYKQAAPQPGSAENGSAASEKVVVGRHNLEEKDATEWAAKLAELVEERMEQLKRLLVVMSL